MFCMEEKQQHEEKYLVCVGLRKELTNLLDSLRPKFTNIEPL